MMRRLLNLLLLLLVSIVWLPAAWAQLPSEQATTPDAAVEAAGRESQVIIRQGQEERFEEYRVGGQIVMIKVTPAKGPVYYLVDTDGDGLLDERRSELSAGVLIPQWKVLEWK